MLPPNQLTPTLPDIMHEHDPESLDSLRESRRQLSTLLSNLPGMAYRTRLDPRWPMEFVSDGCLSLTGHYPASLIGGNPDWGSVILPEDREIVWECVHNAVVSRRVFTLTYRINTASSQIRWVWEQGRGVYSDDGEILAVEGFVTDITERRSVEERLQRSNKSFAFLTRISESIVRIRHPASLMEEVCRITVEEAGLPAAWIAVRKGLLGKSAEVLALKAKTPDLTQALLGEELLWRLDDDSPVARATSTGRSQELLVPAEADDGSSWPPALRHFGLVSLGVFPLFVGGTPIGAMGIYQEIDGPFDQDEARLFESIAGELSFALDKAEEENRRRALESDLARARSIETLGRVSGSLAHDFNNILMIISACTESIGRTACTGSSPQRELDQIQKACERGSDLTRRLLAFGRKPSRQVRRLDLGCAVRDASHLLQRVLGKSYDFELSVEQGIHPVVLDSAELDQVLLNLVLNAKDAMPEGGRVTITVAGSGTPHPFQPPDSSQKPYVRLAVEDTGCGMAPGVRERIFEPFFTTKEREAGSGLGLSIAFDMARRSGGWINAADGASGIGTRVELFFPRAAL